MRYLAPLNYDRYFKKCFSDVRIAQRFLEDFLDVTIEEITLLPEKHKVTDDASVVEFDFRCKINGQYIIIDMQQWYKMDIIHRFYVYHTVNTALQLDNLPLKSVTLADGKQKEIKDYSLIEPVLTIVWMADDVLGFKQDYVSYSMTPEIVADFLEKESLWRNPVIADLLKEREEALSILQNKTKKLHFLRQNRLIYAFQKNIIRNQKFAKYMRWFEFAEKTKDKNNEKADFVQYEKDEIFAEMLKRLDTKTFPQDDLTYITDYEKYITQAKRLEDGIYRDAWADGMEKGMEQGIEKGREEERIIQEQKRYEEKLATAKILLSQNIAIEIIMTVTGLDKEIIENLA